MVRASVGRRAGAHRRVVVKVAKAELVVGEAVVGTVSGNTVLDVTATEDDWLWVRHGWIRRDDTVPLDKAVDYFTNEIRGHPSAANYLARGLLHRACHEYPQALDDLNATIRLDAKSAAAYYARAEIYAAERRYDEALVDYGRAVQLGHGVKPLDFDLKP